MGVNHQCQCPLFKQFTTGSWTMPAAHPVSIINVNVLFLSNSQPSPLSAPTPSGVNHQCQCPLFKQFTTAPYLFRHTALVSIINVNVLFLSNSQLQRHEPLPQQRCQSSMSMSSFYAIHNSWSGRETETRVSIINVNVLFLAI